MKKCSTMILLLLVTTSYANQEARDLCVKQFNQQCQTKCKEANTTDCTQKCLDDAANQCRQAGE